MSKSGEKTEQPEIAETRSDKLKIDGKNLIRDALVIDAVIYIIIGI